MTNNLIIYSSCHLDYSSVLRIVEIIIDEMALYRFFTGTAVSAKTQKHDVFLKPTVPGKKSN